MIHFHTHHCLHTKRTENESNRQGWPKWLCVDFKLHAIHFISYFYGMPEHSHKCDCLLWVGYVVRRIMTHPCVHNAKCRVYVRIILRISGTVMKWNYIKMTRYNIMTFISPVRENDKFRETTHDFIEIKILWMDSLIHLNIDDKTTLKIQRKNSPSTSIRVHTTRTQKPNTEYRQCFIQKRFQSNLTYYIIKSVIIYICNMQSFNSKLLNYDINWDFIHNTENA